MGAGLPIGAFWVAEQHASTLQAGMHGTTYGHLFIALPALPPPFCLCPPAPCPLFPLMLTGCCMACCCAVPAWVTAHTATQSGMQAATLWSARWPTPSCRSAVPGSPSAVLAPLARDGVACVCVCVRVWGGAQAIEEEGIEANVRARGEQLTAGLHDLAARYAPLYPWQHACALTVFFC
jgi:hypothetical protein